MKALFQRVLAFLRSPQGSALVVRLKALVTRWRAKKNAS